MRSNNELTNEQRLDRLILGIRVAIEDFTDIQLKELMVLVIKETKDREEDDRRFNEVGDLDE